MANSGYWQERWKKREWPTVRRATTYTASDNPVALGLVLVGAGALAISVFLPLVQPLAALQMVEDNTLIQHGGWGFVAVALVIAVYGYRINRGRSRSRMMPVILCAIAAILLFTMADQSTRILYPIGPDGNVDTSQPGVITHFGIGVYVAGAAIVAAFIGSVMLAQGAKPIPDSLVAGQADSATKKCPDCAETILRDANVCKHCGYRFEH